MLSNNALNQRSVNLDTYFPCDVHYVSTSKFSFSGFQDSHLWFSVASRQAQSNFTSVQRLSCCLALLMTYMLANIMFYGVDSEPGEAEMDVGFFSMSWTEMRIGQT